MERPLAIPIWSVNALRSYVEEAEPGKDLFFRIAPSVSFDEARKLWETVSVAGGDGLLVNLEVLWLKEEARAFVERKIRELEEWRDLLNIHIGTMMGLCKFMERSIEKGGPELPADYNPVMMHGPKVFLHLDKIRTVPNDAADRQGILDRFGAGAAPEYREVFKYRELRHRLALVNFNISFVKLKIEGLILQKDRLSEGIESFKQQFKDQTYLGCGNPEFENFLDFDMVRVSQPNKDQE